MIKQEKTTESQRVLFNKQILAPPPLNPPSQESQLHQTFPDFKGGGVGVGEARSPSLGCLSQTNGD